MSHTHNTPISNFSTADLPTDMAEGSVAFDTDTQELVAYKNGSWESLGSGGGIGSTTYMRLNVAGEIGQIQGDITAVKVQDEVNSGGGYGNNTSVKGLVIGTSCTNIGSNAFYFYVGLTGDLVIPDSVTWIGTVGDNFGDSGVFAGATYGPNLTIGKNVENVGQWDFAFNNNLINVNCYITKTIIDSGRGEVFLGNQNMQTIHVRANDDTWTAGPNQTIGSASSQVTVIKDL
jgi:hypothetical protein